MLKQIMVPLDGSPLAETALGYAAQIIDKSKPIHLLVVLSNIDNFFLPTTAPVDYMDNELQAARTYLDKVSKKVQQNYRVGCSLEVRVGEPAQTITEVAKEIHADAIVMSTHGRSAVNRVIFGSVTQKVLSSMPCPVFVIPGRETVPSTQPIATQLRPATS